MQTRIEGEYELFLELRRDRDPKSPPVFHEKVTADIKDLAHETYIRGVLADAFPADAEDVRVRFWPSYLKEPPLVEKLSVELSAGESGPRFSLNFDTGPWSRRALRRAAELRQEGTLEEGDVCYRSLVATPNGKQPDIDPPTLQPPAITDATLEELGVDTLGEGTLMHDRPILVNQQFEREIIQKTIDSGAIETGGAVLGRMARLPEALPGTNTRIVTVLAAGVCDQRHVGSAATYEFSTDALADAAQIAKISGRCVLTTWHAHGWGCGDCNQKDEGCPLVEATYVSPADYQMAQSLFPSKATLIPISGRRYGAEGREPLLVIHGWRNGELKPMRFQRYSE